MKRFLRETPRIVLVRTYVVKQTELNVTSAGAETKFLCCCRYRVLKYVAAS